MTTNYHTAISVGAAANAATFNAPLGQLDAAINSFTYWKPSSDSTTALQFQNAAGDFIINLDTTNKYIEIWSDIRPYANPTDGFPLGNDLHLQCRGPADITLEAIAIALTSTTTVAAPGSVTINVGDTSSLSELASLFIENEDVANAESIAMENWSIASASTVTATFAKAHTQPFEVEQRGAIYLKGNAVFAQTQDFYLQSSDGLTTLLIAKANAVDDYLNIRGHIYMESGCKYYPQATTGSFIVASGTGEYTDGIRITGYGGVTLYSSWGSTALLQAGGWTGSSYHKNVGIGLQLPTAKLHVDQSANDAAIPVLTLDQADVSEPFIKLIGESTTDNSQSLIDAADLEDAGAIVGWFKVYVEDVQGTNPITDGTYWVPFYATPTHSP